MNGNEYDVVTFVFISILVPIRILVYFIKPPARNNQARMYITIFLVNIDTLLVQ